jgi:hypothetical protein
MGRNNSENEQEKKKDALVEFGILISGLVFLSLSLFIPNK